MKPETYPTRTLAEVGAENAAAHRAAQHPAQQGMPRMTVTGERIVTPKQPNPCSLYWRMGDALREGVYRQELAAWLDRNTVVRTLINGGSSTVYFVECESRYEALRLAFQTYPYYVYSNRAERAECDGVKGWQVTLYH